MILPTWRARGEDFTVGGLCLTQVPFFPALWDEGVSLQCHSDHLELSRARACVSS